MSQALAQRADALRSVRKFFVAWIPCAPFAVARFPFAVPPQLETRSTPDLPRSGCTTGSYRSGRLSSARRVLRCRKADYLRDPLAYRGPLSGVEAHALQQRSSGPAPSPPRPGSGSPVGVSRGRLSRIQPLRVYGACTDCYALTERRTKRHRPIARNRLIPLKHRMEYEPSPKSTSSRLPCIELKGTDGARGMQYAAAEGRRMIPFFSTHVRESNTGWELARASWPILQRRLPRIAAFVKGMATAFDGNVVRATLHLLHEELVHMEHCSAVASRRTPVNGGPILGQNWDWPIEYFNLAHIVRQSGPSVPDSVTYAYPGLWSAAGLNDEGLAMMWSGAGYWPAVEPRPGIPTYALLAGILEFSTVAQALELIGQNEHAGCFIVFLADRTGDIAVVEAWPGGHCVDKEGALFLRTNHFLCERSIIASSQLDPASITESTTASRYIRLRQLSQSAKEWNLECLRTLLQAPDIGAPLQPPDGSVQRRMHTACTPGEAASSYTSVTIDTIAAEPMQPVLWIARGRHGESGGQSHFIPYSVSPTRH